MQNGRSYLVVGCRSLDVLKRTFKTKKVQKYNEDTGKPYIWEQKEEFWVLFGKEYWEDYPLEGALRDLDKDLCIFEHRDRDSDDYRFDPGDSGLFGYEAHSTDGMDTNFVKIDWIKIQKLITRFYQVTGAQPEVFLFRK